MKPDFFRPGEKCIVGGYNWKNNGMFCWRKNWHVPVWNKNITISSEVLIAFQAGITTYSFVDFEEQASIPIFVFKFSPPLGFWPGAVNTRPIHPETLFEVTGNAPNTVTFLIFRNNRVIDSFTIEIEQSIMMEFYEAISRQAMSQHTVREIDAIRESLTPLQVKELFMIGKKGNLK